MEPQIQYARTSDGVSIACYALGDGPGFIWMDLPYSHLLAEWANPNTRAVYEGNSTVATFVRFDHRGFGLSDRDVTDFSLDKMVLDVEAVVERLGFTRFALGAWRGLNTPIAVAYAARHPEQLTHLLLAQGAARAPRVWQDAISGLLMSSDWRFVTESLSRMVQGWDNDDVSRELATLLRASVEPRAFAAFWQAAASWDVRDLLPKVVTPTLLVHWKDHLLFGPEHARELVSAIPNTRAVVIDGVTPAERDAQYQDVFQSFFGVRSGAAARSGDDPRPTASLAGTAIIMFTDIVDSTGLTERIGDAAFRARARNLDDRLRAIVRDRAGTPIEGKLLGDGLLATFPAASAAIEAALAFEAAAAAARLELHLGLHAGDVIREDGNVFGGAVNIAARIAAISAPGEVLVSDVVRALARTSAGVTFDDRGEHPLKGIADPQRVFAVRRT